MAKTWSKVNIEYKPRNTEQIIFKRYMSKTCRKTNFEMFNKTHVKEHSLSAYQEHVIVHML